MIQRFVEKYIGDGGFCFGCLALFAGFLITLAFVFGLVGLIYEDHFKPSTTQSSTAAAISTEGTDANERN